MSRVKKFKLFVTAIAMLFLIMAPSAHIYAAEVSEQKIEVPQDENGHRVIAFGKAITIIYADGRMEIIPNNPSGRIDVMIDGLVTQGIGIVIIPAKSRTNMVLEEGSFIINNINEEQAAALKKMTLESLSADTVIESLAVIEGQKDLQNVNAFAVGSNGTLQNSEGAEVSVDVLSGVQVKTPAVVYEEFANEMQERILEEQKLREEQQAAVTSKEDDKKEDNNSITICEEHDYEVIFSYPGTHDYLLDIDYYCCYLGTFEQCKICGRSNPNSLTMYKHGEEFCSVCGYNQYGQRKDQSASVENEENEVTE